VSQRSWNIIVHPDVIFTPKLWRQFLRRLLVENMDRRKTTGRTVEELTPLFKELPEARFCLDVAHARQLDTTLTLLTSLATTFQDRIAEIHISELDSRCRHRPMSGGAVADYRRLATLLRDFPVIIESELDRDHSSLRQQEVEMAKAAFNGDGGKCHADFLSANGKSGS
jgi:Xylose isomerase-like TIM barrel